MTWMLWIVIAYFFIEGVYVVATIGRPKTPTTPGEAAGVLVILAALAALIFFGGVIA